MKTAIKIPVFEYTDEEIELDKQGLDSKELGFSKVEERFFWSIDSAYMFEGPEGAVYTAFFSGGTNFVTPAELKDFVKLINNHNNNETRN